MMLPSPAEVTDAGCAEDGASRLPTLEMFSVASRLRPIRPNTPSIATPSHAVTEVAAYKLGRSSWTSAGPDVTAWRRKPADGRFRQLAAAEAGRGGNSQADVATTLSLGSNSHPASTRVNKAAPSPGGRGHNQETAPLRADAADSSTESLMETDTDRGGATACFLHGLESSSRGTKGRWLVERFPAVRMHDYHGDLHQRLEQLTDQVAGLNDLILIGSSFGGLMAACFAARHPARCRRLVLLAPALNIARYRPPPEPLDVETLVVLGAQDTICPPDLVLPLARSSFRTLEIRLEEDNHLLHRVFPLLDWRRLLD